MMKLQELIIFVCVGIGAVSFAFYMGSNVKDITKEREIDTIEYTKIILFVERQPELDKNVKGMLENDGIITINEYNWLIKQRDKYQKEELKKKIITR